MVHCSAGIGRTGVLILMETAACMIEANEPVYPLELVRIMRDQRAMLVQTPVSGSLQQKTGNSPFPGPIPICVRIDSKSLSGRTHQTAGRVSEEKLIYSSTLYAPQSMQFILILFQPINTSRRPQLIILA